MTQHRPSNVCFFASPLCHGVKRSICWTGMLRHAALMNERMHKMRDHHHELCPLRVLSLWHSFWLRVHHSWKSWGIPNENILWRQLLNGGNKSPFSSSVQHSNVRTSAWCRRKDLEDSSGKKLIPDSVAWQRQKCPLAKSQVFWMCKSRGFWILNEMPQIIWILFCRGHRSLRPLPTGQIYNAALKQANNAYAHWWVWAMLQ